MDHNTLLIRNGFTHYPQKGEQFRFFPGDPNLPDRIIILDASGAISLHALSWMTDQKISLVQLDWRGRVNFSGNSGFSADPKLVKWQIEVRDTPKAQGINRRLIAAKLDASIDTLSKIFAQSQSREIAIGKIRGLKAKIQNTKKDHSYRTILGLEGAAAAIYYSTWHGLPLKWTNLSRRPIPDYWQKIGSRQMAWRKDANFARHPLNAMLNYGYGILASRLQTEIVASGFDPSIGIAHKRWTNRVPLAYDLMEPLRPVVDRVVLEFALSHVFEPSDFAINRLGGCRLNPQLAKSLAESVLQLSCSGIAEKYLL